MIAQTYLQGIKAVYQGETIGERLFRRLAERSDNLEHRAMLQAIADVEALTRCRLQPIANRLGVQQLDEAEMNATIERRATQLAALSWPDFISKALTDWPPYIAEFEALARMAPPVDAQSLQVLVDHERALVEFVRLEHANNTGSGDTLQPLRRFLAGHAL